MHLASKYLQIFFYILNAIWEELCYYISSFYDNVPNCLQITCLLSNIYKDKENCSVVLIINLNLKETDYILKFLLKLRILSHSQTSLIFVYKEYTKAFLFFFFISTRKSIRFVKVFEFYFFFFWHIVYKMSLCESVCLQTCLSPCDTTYLGTLSRKLIDGISFFFQVVPNKS